MKKDKEVEFIVELLGMGLDKAYALIYRKYFRSLFAIAYCVLRDEEASHQLIDHVLGRLIELNQGKGLREFDRAFLFNFTWQEALVWQGTSPVGEKLPIEQRLHMADYIDWQDCLSEIEAADPVRQDSLILKRMGGLTYKEISDITGRPLRGIHWLCSTSECQTRLMLILLTSALAFTGISFIFRLTSYFKRGINLKVTYGSQGLDTLEADPLLIPYGLISIFLLVLLGLVLNRSHVYTSK